MVAQLVLLSISAFKSDAVEKPCRLFLSAPDSVAIKHKNARGTLIRVFWSQIEPTKEQFDFSAIRRQLKRVEGEGKGWSLGVVAGQHAPTWMTEDSTIQTINFNFRRTTSRCLPTSI